jgi:hypothetical protein
MKNTLPRLALLAAVFAVAPLFAANVNGTLQHDVMAKEKFPGDNFGSDPQLQVSNQSTFRKFTYVRFSVSGIPAGSTAISAQLKLRSLTTGTGRTVTAHAVSDITWTEGAVTWTAKPALGASLSTVSSHTSGQDSVWPLGTHVNGNGTFSVGLDTTFSGDTTFSSKEGANAPQLVVTYTPPAVTPTVSFNATDFNASETSLDPATIQVVSSAPAPTGGLVVKYSLGGAAEANHNDNGAPDYILSPANGTASTGSVTIAAGNTTANITLTPIQDTLSEGKETAIFTLTSDPAYTVGAPRVAQVVVADNEPLPTVNPDHLTGQQGGWLVPITGTLPNGECSGMVVSRVYPGVHWYHRDATTNTGDPRTRLYAIELSHASNNGTVIKTIDITAPPGWSDVWGNDPSHQWEDAAEDPGVPGVIWIGDIGNNNGRNVIRLFKVNEPNPYGAGTSVQATAGYYLKYPAGVSVNAECLFIFEGIPHIITKEGTARIYRSPTTTLSTNSASPTLMELVGNPVGAGGNHSVSSFSADRKRMVLATHGGMWVYVSQSGLDPVNNTLTPAQALSYIQDLLCTRAPVWALKHNGGQQDPEAQLGSVEGGSFVGDGYDVLFGAEGRQVTFIPAWWYETQPGPIPAVPTGESANNSAPDTFLFKPVTTASFSKAAGSIALQAAASDYDGTIGNVKFYHKLSSAPSRTLIGTGTSAGGYHSINWTISGVATGSYTLSADATDNSGGITTDSVTITINP